MSQRFLFLNIYMEQTTNLTIADLDALRNIIDLACKRGAFQASEMSYVGENFDRLNQFLEAIIQQAQEPAESQGEQQ